MDLIALGTLGLNEAKDLRGKCEKQGIELVLNHNEASCTRGCAVTVEVLINPQDIEVFSKIQGEEYAKMLEGMDVNLEQINSVYDENSAEATCPACGTIFSTSQTECPDCGLNFG